MQPTTPRPTVKPGKTTPTHRSPRTVDPGEAGRQHVSRQRIDCEGGPDVAHRAMRARGAGTPREDRYAQR